MKKNVYSVGQVNQYIRNMFAQDFLLRNICVQGEVSNWKRHTSGHIFFSLKDKTGVLSAVMFSSDVRTGLTTPVRDGDEVQVSGQIRVYERSGQYQLYAKEIVLAGAGALYQKFEALKKELAEMGMFDEVYKKPLPRFPKTVGVVTAPTGAAIRDIQNISARRNPYVQMILYPAQVQGEGAAESVAAGIAALETYGVDVIIIGRGGGSIEDLWAFNEESLARSIFACCVPVVSAVGHETDTTISDYVADMRAPTPSAAAELVVPDIREILKRVEQSRAGIRRFAEYRLGQERIRLQALRAKMESMSPAHQMKNRRLYLVECQDKMENLVKGRLQQQRHRVSQIALRQTGLIEAALSKENNRLKAVRIQLPGQMQQVFEKKRHQMELYASRLDAASPLKKLSSGYGFLEDADGKGILSVGTVSPRDRFRARLADGDIFAEVKDVIHKEAKK